jgi:cyclopropane-fatty-acyl-phospholipid synthase
MEPLVRKIEAQLADLPVGVSLDLPGGLHAGPANAAVRLKFEDWSGLATFAAGQIGRIAEDYVEKRCRIEGRMRDVMAAAAALLPGSPVQSDTSWWTLAACIRARITATPPCRWPRRRKPSWTTSAAS